MVLCLGLLLNAKQRACLGNGLKIKLFTMKACLSREAPMIQTPHKMVVQMWLGLLQLLVESALATEVRAALHTRRSCKGGQEQ